MAVGLPDQFYKVVCDHSCDEIWVTDAEGNTLYVNPACEELYGEKLENLIGRNVRDLELEGYFHPAVAPLVIAEKKSITLTQRIRTGRVMLITGTPVFDAHGNLQYVVENSRDVTSLEYMRETYESVQAAQAAGGAAQAAGGAAQAAGGAADPRGTTGRPSDDRKEGHIEPVCTGKVMRDVLRLATRAAAFDANILITGESGTGKDVLAHFVHRKSPRRGGPFLKLSCPALPEEILESELFGYKPGAFTGANRQGKPGLLELANGGTVFLDEVGDLPLSIQAKLLQVIEDRTFIPVGGTKSSHADFRIIAATNQDLDALVKAGRFRADLNYRLNVIALSMPPLRSRKEEIPGLVSHFTRAFSRKYRGTKEIAPAAMEALKQYDWPGNIRELQHLLEYLFVTCESRQIDWGDLPERVRCSVTRGYPQASPAEAPGTAMQPQLPSDATVAGVGPAAAVAPPRPAPDAAELLRLYETLGSTYKVARATGLSQSTVYRRISGHRRRGDGRP
ncbi:MAG: sigma 54-interacting transcriptional regulator [Firmicutes bacterium]|nr:sigma 54-interacting transcriptional regulator [Bacillota bacterium]